MDAVDAAREKIFSQSQELVITGNRQAAKCIKLTFRRALVGIDQRFPLFGVGGFRRLTAVNGVLVALFIAALVAIAIFYVGNRLVARRDAIDDLLQQFRL